MAPLPFLRRPNEKHERVSQPFARFSPYQMQSGPRGVPHVLARRGAGDPRGVAERQGEGAGAGHD
eukprot:scaffold69_cov248-Pinguiococcus_pyrenoidosus.AAC.53